MTIKSLQFENISPYLTIQRGNISIDNLTLANAILYIAKNGVLQRLFLALQKEQIAVVNAAIIWLDSTCAKLHMVSADDKPNVMCRGLFISVFKSFG